MSAICVKIFPFDKDTSRTGRGSTLMTSFELEDLCKDPRLQIKAHADMLVLGLQHINLVEGQYSTP